MSLSTLFRAGVLAALLTLGLACTAEAAERWWLGPSFEELPLTSVTGPSFIYGDCDPGPDEGGCAPPLEVQNWSTCERNPVKIDLPADRLYRLRDGGVAAVYGRNQGIDLLTGRSTATVFADDEGRATRAVKALRRRSELAPPTRLPGPRFPVAVLQELKRIAAARREHSTSRSISKATGVPVRHVQVRLLLVELIGDRALRNVRTPHTSWRTIQRYRQAAFTVQEEGERAAEREFKVTRRQLGRMIHRVRGLAGPCSSR